MTREEYLKYHQDTCAQMVAITTRKNMDYTGGNGDPFANFKRIADLVDNKSSIEIGFLARMSDKLSRIGSFVSKGTLAVKDESVEDTLLDLANYCILFSGYLKSIRPQELPRTAAYIPPDFPATGSWASGAGKPRSDNSHLIGTEAP
jgi:hypothetical protein